MYSKEMLYLTLFIASVTTIILLLWRRLTFWSKQGVKGFRFVDLRGYMSEHHQYTYDMFKKYGKVYGGFGMTERYLVVNDPDLIKEIFVKNFHTFPHHTMFNIGSDPKVNKMLFFMPGDENWKRVRSIITPAFTAGKLKAMMSHISDISDNLLKNLEKYEQNGEMVDIRQYLGAFAMDVISACAYGIKIDSINNPEHPVVVNAKKFFGVNATFNVILSVMAPNIARFLNLDFFDPSGTKYFDVLTNQIVNERKNINRYSIGEKGKKRTDFIQLMMDSEKSNKEIGYESNSDEELVNKEQNKNKSIGTLTPDELTGQGILFFLAGYDTTSGALSHLVYYLSKNKECQQRLYEELKDIEEFSYERLSQLKYMNAVIDETLRLAPSALRIQRQSEHDFELSGSILSKSVRIPKGTSIAILPYALHRDPDYWPEPLKFKPERFLQPKHNTYAYIPFGAGPRICLGQRFALNEMRMCCAKLFKRFEFNLNPNFEELEYFKGNVLFSPKNVMVNLKAR